VTIRLRRIGGKYLEYSGGTEVPPFACERAITQTIRSVKKLRGG